VNGTLLIFEVHILLLCPDTFSNLRFTVALVTAKNYTTSTQTCKIVPGFFRDYLYTDFGLDSKTERSAAMLSMAKADFEGTFIWQMAMQQRYQT